MRLNLQDASENNEKAEIKILKYWKLTGLLQEL